MKFELIYLFLLCTLNCQQNSFKIVESKRIILSDKIPIGIISDISIINNCIYISDMISNHILSYTEAGTFLKSFNTNSCNPGSIFTPLQIIFSSNYIAVLKGESPFIFVFTKNWDCIGPSMINANIMRIYLSEDNFLYTYENDGSHCYLGKYKMDGSLVKKIMRGDDRFSKIIYRLPQAGLLIDKKYIYCADANSYKIDIYDLALNKIKTIGKKPFFYNTPNAPSRVFDPNNPQKIFKEITKTFENKTSLLSIHFWDKDKLLLQFSDGKNRKIGIQIINNLNQMVFEVLTDITHRFETTYGKYLIQSDYHSPDIEDLKNPNIVFYELNSVHKK